MEAVRERTSRRSSTGLSPFIAEMLIQHEHQHNETMLQTLQLAEPGVYAPEPRAARRDGRAMAASISRRVRRRSASTATASRTTTSARATRSS